ncbi:MAG: MBL fold metallo-hydrolase, partial [Oscillospiraceae bacterium]|nr:MBL fold metallo-hydrolase [Oscillospiraceae bacterium]
MTITKYPQSCLLVESGATRLLFDPGILKYEERFFDEWSSCDAVFITHKHTDHCNAEILSKLDPSIPLYTTAEVTAAHASLSRANLIKEGDAVSAGCFSVTAVKAVHGYHPRMRGNEVYENIGFLVCDGKVTLYITSDTVCFP